MDKTTSFTLFLLIIIALIVVFNLGLIPFNLTGSFVSQEEVSASIENLYELVNPGVDVTV